MDITKIRKNRYRYIKCKCGRTIRLINPLLANGDKSHKHCKECNLEWHWHVFKGIYSHPIDRTKKKPNQKARLGFKR